MGQPFVHPTGVTIYDPEKAWSGYTLMPIAGVGAVLVLSLIHIFISVSSCIF